MDTSELLSDGLNLAMIGIGFVFLFLTVLVLVTMLMSFIIIRYERRVGLLPADGVPAPTAVLGNFQNEPAVPPKDANLISVLSGAVHRYRSRRKK